MRARAQEVAEDLEVLALSVPPLGYRGRRGQTRVELLVGTCSWRGQMTYPAGARPGGGWLMGGSIDLHSPIPRRSGLGRPYPAQE
eukprot:2834995-Pyramimonas_sp.AAC.1